MRTAMRAAILLAVTLVLSGSVDANDATNDVAVKCRDGWVSALGNCYLMNNITTTYWTSARTFCDRHNFGSKLLVLESEEEKKLIDGLLGKYPDVSTWWTGYRGVDDTGRALEAGDEPQPPSNVTLLYDTEPNNADGNEDCVVMDDRGRFRDVSCSQRNKVMCEIAKPSITSSCPTQYGYQTVDIVWSCYYIGSYKGLYTWKGAKSACQTIKAGSKIGHLVSLNSGGELATIQAKIRGTFGTYWYWTGLNDLAEEGTFVYDDHSTANKVLMPWLDESNIAGDKSMCLQLVAGMLLSPSLCYSSRSGYICKQKAVSEPETKCPDYWLRGGDSCYLPSYDRQNWNDAADACNKKGAHLLKTDTYVERNWLDAIEIWKRPLGYFNNYWTGLSNIATNDTYTWQDGSPINDKYISWPRGSAYSPDTRCTALYRNSEVKWVNCDYRGASACQYVDDKIEGCVPGWTRNNHICYFNAGKTAVWEAGLEACKSDVMNRAKRPEIVKKITYLTIESTKQLKFLADFLKTNYYTWLGLNDRETYGVPKWQGTNVTVQSDIPSFASEPDKPRTQQCVAYNKGGLYTTENCDEPRYYICELEKAWGPHDWPSTSAQTGSASHVPVSYLLITLSAIFYFAL